MIRPLSKDKTVSFVIPCFNEEAVLPQLFNRIEDVAANLSVDWEAILVDDGSHDKTWDLITAMSERNHHWKGVRLARNFGHQIAVWAGLQYSGGDAVTILDADLQDPPELVSTFLARWSEGYDVTYAIRKKRKEGFLKRTAYYAFYRILALLAAVKMPLDSGDFSLMDRRVVNAMLSTREHEPYVRGLRAWVGFNQIGVPYERASRAGGDAKYGLWKLMQLAADGVFSFSIVPLRIATIAGFVVSAFAFCGIGLVLIQRLFTDTFSRLGLPFVPGFAALSIAILFLGGVQLICLGIVGEYIGRIYETVKGRPLFTVGEVTGFEVSDRFLSENLLGPRINAKA